jgi:hypothetical protein
MRPAESALASFNRLSGRSGLGTCDQAHLERIKMQFGKAAAQSGDESWLMPTLDHPADHFRHGPGAHAAIVEPQFMQLPPQYIHPIERTVALRP